ncbi:tripartite tricarboxylate transporter family receptor [Sinorhizobium sp. KGO-5]|uniref:tripartite tricarboxylate transporter substrate-binding protein n=1 Tax=Sinorhizobium sp. KGO-5 TaxID=1470810 RepID=UPI00294A06D1|nr:tripartite tricarboxylate transporter family receptor [Sinorhizobium sp. KGO-5]
MKFLATLAASIALCATTAFAQEDYPSRTITLLVPFAAGGPTDTIARLTADAMSKSLGQQIVVENAVGAGGTIATRRASDAEPDGYTLLIHHVGISTAPTLYRKLPFDTLKDLQTIGLVSDAAMTVIARTDFPAQNFPDLVKYVKEKQADVTFANAGLGAASHLCGTLFMSSIGAQLTTVSYKGNGPIMTDLIGKQIDMTCDQVTNTLGPIKQNQVKAYVITSPERSKDLPDLVTAKETGFPQFELSVWHGLYAPTGTPEETVTKLSGALQAAMEDATLKERFAQLATAPASKDQATPAALRTKLESEINRWGPILKAAGQFAD